MKALLASFFILAATVARSQNYLDLLTLAYGFTPATGYDAGNGQTRLSTLDLNVLLPVPLNEHTALMTGVTGLINRLEPAPQAGELGVYNLALQAGINRDYGNGWSSTHLLLPRLTSAFDQPRKSLQIGTAHLLQHKISPNRSWGLGLYLNTEEQGLMLVPLFSYYYKSPGGNWEFNALLPSRADLNIQLTRGLSGGLAFDGLGNSFATDLAPYGKSYVQRSSSDLSGYLQVPITRSLLLTGRVGYSFFRAYRIFEADDTVRFSFMNIFIDDPRTVLNESIKDGAFFNFRVIYRFYLPGS